MRSTEAIVVPAAPGASPEAPASIPYSTPGTAWASDRTPLPPLPAGDGPVPRWMLLAAGAAVVLLYALLWSPWWYPLSDSSLYLIMARNLSNGQGFKSLAAVHKSVRPMTPALLWLVLRAGGGIGAMHAAMIAATLLAHLLSFLTLRRWFNERVALAAVLATAVSWWVFINAFTIMTEPLFLVMWWACVLTLSYVPGAAPRRQWALVIVAVGFLAGTWGNRMAGVLLWPGALGGILLGFRGVVPLKLRLAWAGIFVAVLAVLWGVYFWKGGAGPVNPKTPTPTENGSIVSDGDELELSGDVRRAKTETYKWNVLVGVSSPLVQLPVMGGRWVLESLAAALSVPALSKSRALSVPAGIMAALAFLMAIVGWVRLVRQRRWWAAAALLYFLPFWIMWGTRVKPRYMVPIIPLLFIVLWQGSAAVAAWPLGKILADRARAFRLASRAAVGLLLVGGVALNAFPYAVEVYLRRNTSHDFYDLARRGGFAELIDIGAYLQGRATRDDDIWVNRGAYRRIIGLLANHDPRVIRRDAPIQDPGDAEHLKVYFERIGSGKRVARYAIVFYEARPWPAFHWPLPGEAETNASPRWWQLYERDEKGEYQLVRVPRNRAYARTVPGAGKGSSP